SARGIDIQNDESVVNYDLPESLEYYVPNVGRKGQGSHIHQAGMFLNAQEKELSADIENNLGKLIQRIEISKNDYKYTLDFTEDKSHDWKKLMKEIELEENTRKKRKKKSKR
ncbi:MAG: hypothetical protein K8R46_04855, partial [Pirellulales bacterium]|nr:hypothetical protein [Pirellulales bacterium]